MASISLEDQDDLSGTNEGVNLLGYGSSIIKKKDDSRPQITGFINDGQQYISKYETENINKLLREYKKRDRETIFTMTLNDIIEHTVLFISEYPTEFSKKMYEVTLDFSLVEGPENNIQIIKKYILAFMLHLGDKDNILYFGIILITLSIILYFFNITTQ